MTKKNATEDEKIVCKTPNDVLNNIKKKKEVSPAIIGLFENLEKIINTEIDPLIKKVKNDLTNEDNREKLRKVYVALVTINAMITQYTSKCIVVTLAKANNIKEGKISDIDTKSEDESSEESESSGSGSDSSGSDKKSKKKTPSKKVVTEKPTKKKDETSESDTSSSDSE